MSWKQRLILVSLLLPVAAQSTDVFVPDELQGWQEWVLHDKDYRACPFYFNGNAAARGDFVCAWPGRLEISIDADGGRFSQQWTVYAQDAWLPLPGNADSRGSSRFTSRLVISQTSLTPVLMHAEKPKRFLSK